MNTNLTISMIFVMTKIPPLLYLLFLTFVLHIHQYFALKTELDLTFQIELHFLVYKHFQPNPIKSSSSFSLTLSPNSIKRKDNQSLPQMHPLSTQAPQYRHFHDDNFEYSHHQTHSERIGDVLMIGDPILLTYSAHSLQLLIIDHLFGIPNLVPNLNEQHCCRTIRMFLSLLTNSGQNEIDSRQITCLAERYLLVFASLILNSQ